MTWIKRTARLISKRQENMRLYWRKQVLVLSIFIFCLLAPLTLHAKKPVPPEKYYLGITPPEGWISAGLGKIGASEVGSNEDFVKGWVKPTEKGNAKIFIKAQDFGVCCSTAERLGNAFKDGIQDENEQVIKDSPASFNNREYYVITSARKQGETTTLCTYAITPNGKHIIYVTYCAPKDVHETYLPAMKKLLSATKFTGAEVGEPAEFLEYLPETPPPLTETGEEKLDTSSTPIPTTPPPSNSDEENNKSKKPDKEGDKQSQHGTNITQKDKPIDLGITVDDVREVGAEDKSQYFKKGEKTKGVVILRNADKIPAVNPKIQNYDLLLELDGKKIDDKKTFKEALKEANENLQSGKTLSAIIRRRGKSEETVIPEIKK